jgi:S1-C subfamily serine protease
VLQPGTVARGDTTFEYYADQGGYAEIVHVSATLQPGTSGGAWLDRSGRVVGLQSGVMSVNSAPVGLAFVSPVDALRQLLRSRRHAATPALGFAVEEAWQQDRGFLARFPPATEGLVVKALGVGGPGARAGLQAGDLIAAADGRTLRYPDDFLRWVSRQHPGDTLALKVRRPDNAGFSEVAVTLGRAEAAWAGANP